MTNNEAIETIKLAISEVEWVYPMDYAVAFEMAIQALNTLNEIEKCIKFHNLEIKSEMELLTGFEDFVIEQMKELKE